MENFINSFAEITLTESQQEEMYHFMLIDLKKLQIKYKLKLETIIHVGAHTCEEYGRYNHCGASRIFWIEANRELVKRNISKLPQPQNIMIEAVVSEFDGETVELNISNNSQASSILKLGLHKKLFPGVRYVDSIVKSTKKLDTLYKNYCNDANIDLLNLDTQGAELLALRGFSENLHKVNTIYTEINTKHVYKDCALLKNLDEYLSQFNFSRVETEMWKDHPWGDAFYLK